MADAMTSDDKPDMRVDQYPVIRRFFSQSPARNTRHMTELYDAIEAAIQARRTMRFMDRTNRPDIGTELENKPANLEYGQLQRASKTIASIPRFRGLICHRRTHPP